MYRGESLWRWCIFDIVTREKEIKQLEKLSVQPDFWSDQGEAQRVMRQLSEQKKLVERWRGLERRISDIVETLPLAEEETSFREEIEVLLHGGPCAHPQDQYLLRLGQKCCRVEVIVVASPCQVTVLLINGH